LSLSVFINIMNIICPVYFLPYNEVTHFEIAVCFYCDDGVAGFSDTVLDYTASLTVCHVSCSHALVDMALYSNLNYEVLKY